VVEQFRVLSTLGMLGYGIPETSLRRGVERRPHVIGADAGSTDAGPHKLGRGVPDVSREMTRRDLEMMLLAGRQLGVPVIVGSAGGSGAGTHVEWTWEIVRDIASARQMKLRVAVIHADVSKATVGDALRSGEIRPLGPVAPLTERTLAMTSSVVAQMGIEPYIEALDAGADLILAGRSCDAAIFAAGAVRAGADPGLAWHMGEILECGAMCAEPGSANDCLLGSVEDGCFVLEPTNPARACTPLSVACHSLYERSSASRSEGPGHVLDMSACRFEALDERRVAVSGSRYIPKPLAFKLEGARSAGFRTVVIGGIRDPIAISRLDEMTGAVRSATEALFPERDYRLRFVIYGRDGVMAEREPTPVAGHEVGILLDVVAPSQERADAVCAFARSQLQHYHYEGIKATAANIAFPTAPSDIRCGEVFEFSIYHLMSARDPRELFPVEYRSLGS
jgi:hypothetical protein